MPKEFEFLAKLQQKYSLSETGDDCAVLPHDSLNDFLISTDLIVEDIDFTRAWVNPESLGYKALAVSLSDIAAMGGIPSWSMLSIGIPESTWNTDFLDKFYEGYFKLADEFAVKLIGGDISKTPDKIIVDSIVSGKVPRDMAIRRSGAKPGDLIYVTGELGGAAAGLDLLQNSNSGCDFIDWQDELIARQLRPCPRVNEGKSLIGVASAMIDLSDGLSSDLFHICKASGVGAKIFSDKLPLDKNLISFSKDSKIRQELALNGGEDFELLFTANSKKNIAVEFPAFCCIGEVTANVEIIELICDGKSEILARKGYQHF